MLICRLPVQARSIVSSFETRTIFWSIFLGKKKTGSHYVQQYSVSGLYIQVYVTTIARNNFAEFEELGSPLNY